MRKLLLQSVTVLFVAAHPAAAAESLNAADVQAGHRLAVMVCANCHAAAIDQPMEPILRPPAPSFEDLAQRPFVTGAWLQNFLKTTHRDFDNQQGMPNPELLDFQIRQVSAYLLSLRKNP